MRQQPASRQSTHATVEQVLQAARSELRRLGSREAHTAMHAATLQRSGRPLVTDLSGGFQAWRAAGPPVEPLDGGGAMRAIECPRGHRLERSADADDLAAVAP